jgi:hypothetical protein
MHIDSFSGAASDLPVKLRSADNVLRVLAQHPRVSTWDMEAGWLRNCIQRLKFDGLIREEDEPYPWLRFTITPNSRAALAAGEQP